MQAHPRPEDAAPSKLFNTLLKAQFPYGEDREGSTALTVGLPDIVRLSRYERRAWVRRKRAFHEFMVERYRQILY